MRQRDGSFPLQRVKVLGHDVIIDVNKTIAPALIVGKNGIQEMFTADPQLHLQAAIARSRVASMQALAPGDAAIESRFGSQFKASGLLNAASAKFAAGKYDEKPPKMLEAPKVVDVPEAPKPVQLIPVEEAIMRNHRTKLVIGQTEQADIVHWNMPEAPHLRVHGKSQGSGKTNLIRCLATNALRVGHHVIVCDRRRFKDWSEFSDKAEFVDTRNPAEFAKVTQRLMDIYQERDAMLGKHGAPNIAKLPNPPQRIVVVVSEFGALCDQAKADGVLDDMLHPLSMVLREAGATGVHVVIEDQFVSDKWPKGISTNAEPVTGYLPQNYGAAGGYWRADKLPAYTFHFGGTVFKAFDMRVIVPHAIAAVRKADPVIDAEYRVIGEGVRDEVPYTPTSGEQATNRGDEQPTNAPTNADGWYEWMVGEYLPGHPELLQVDAQGRGLGVRKLAEAMAELARGDAAQYEAYKGVASELGKRLRAELRLPSGERLGVDVSHGGLS
jgi:hypothetical protein